MRKKILIAEQSDTTRGVAENVLRQHGYEVISVSTGDKALEVLEFSKPNMILVDSAMSTKGKKLLFDRLQEDLQISSIPFLLIADEGDDTLSYPEEVILTRPLDPKELLLKVSVLGGSSGGKKSGGELLDDSLLEEDLLDAALGLDKIDVTDSEVMDPSSVVKKKGAKGIEKMIGMEHDQDLDEDSQKNKVESMRLDDEDIDVDSPKQKSKESSKTGKLEILSDHEQFGLGNESVLERAGEYGGHDYEWFIKEMKKDAAPKSSQAKTAKAATSPAPAKKKADSGKVKSEGGVDKFIEDFKKEVEKFTEVAAPAPAKMTRTSVHKAQPAPAAQPARKAAGLDQISIDQVEVFTRQFVTALAEKVAEKIATKIDPQKLLSLIKNEIISKNQKQ
jgi:DNA-binding response OmpR family regulator